MLRHTQRQVIPGDRGYTAIEGPKDGPRQPGSGLVTFQPLNVEILISDQFCKISFSQGTPFYLPVSHLGNRKSLRSLC